MLQQLEEAEAKRIEDAQKEMEVRALVSVFLHTRSTTVLWLRKKYNGFFVTKAT